MWPPFFFGVIPTYGVLPYAMILCKQPGLSVSLVKQVCLCCLHCNTALHNVTEMNTVGGSVSSTRLDVQLNHNVGFALAFPNCSHSGRSKEKEIDIQA